MRGGPGLPRGRELLGSTELWSGLHTLGWQQVVFQFFSYL